jgi:hypothetical protein
VRANIELHRIRGPAVDNTEARRQQIRSALASNQIIGTAIGVLMATYRLTAEQCFRLLTRASQDQPQTPRHRIRRRHLRDNPVPPTDHDDLYIKAAQGRPQ